MPASKQSCSFLVPGSRGWGGGNTYTRLGIVAWRETLFSDAGRRIKFSDSQPSKEIKFKWVIIFPLNLHWLPQVLRTCHRLRTPSATATLFTERIVEILMIHLSLPLSHSSIGQQLHIIPLERGLGRNDGTGSNCRYFISFLLRFWEAYGWFHCGCRFCDAFERTKFNCQVTWLNNF